MIEQQPNVTFLDDFNRRAILIARSLLINELSRFQNAIYAMAFMFMLLQRDTYGRLLTSNSILYSYFMFIRAI